MDKIKIGDSMNLLLYACEDLEALRFVVQTVEGQKDWPYVRETLNVVTRSLDPVITDMHECIDSISEELDAELTACL